MSEVDRGELAERIDGIAWALMVLAADLDRRGRIDGHDYCRSLERQAQSREGNGLHASAFVLREIAGHLDAACSRPQSPAR